MHSRAHHLQRYRVGFLLHNMHLLSQAAFCSRKIRGISIYLSSRRRSYTIHRVCSYYYTAVYPACHTIGLLLLHSLGVHVVDEEAEEHTYEE